MSLRTLFIEILTTVFPLLIVVLVAAERYEDLLVLAVLTSTWKDFKDSN